MGSDTLIASILIWGAVVTGGANLTRPDDPLPSPEIRSSSGLLKAAPIPIPLAASSVLSSSVEPAPEAIGFAKMGANGLIHLHLRRPAQRLPETLLDPHVGWSPREDIGYGDIQIDRSDPHYNDVLKHLGGLEPGQIKPVPAWKADEKWHCELDPDRGPCPGIHLLPSVVFAAQT